MRRAVRWFVLAALLLPLSDPSPLRASDPSLDRINGIGLIDFGMKPTFKVGDWARYHMSAKSDEGVVDDYTVTVLIGGEEEWWGEDCFWIETVTQSAAGGAQAVASLMSYEVFDDSLALPHMQLYVRKLITSMDADGNPIQVVYKRPASTLKTRETPTSQFKVKVDTLGRESTTVPKGAYDCVKLQFLQGRGATGALGDSTEYTELREVRTTFMSPRVPITHIVREDIEQSYTRKAWKVGYSKDATPTLTLSHTLGSAQLVDCGSNMVSKSVPERLRKSIAEQRVEAARARAPARPAAKKKTG
jgi:hypothetical protein